MRTFRSFVEDMGAAPTTAVGTGHIAGAGNDQPPVSKAAQRKHQSTKKPPRRLLSLRFSK